MKYHLARNNHLVYQLKKFAVTGMSNMLSSSSTARNNLCQLKGLRTLVGAATNAANELTTELIRRLKNLDEMKYWYYSFFIYYFLFMKISKRTEHLATKLLFLFVVLCIMIDFLQFY